MPNEVQFDEKEGIINLVFRGDQTYETIHALWPDVENAAKKLHESNRPIFVLGDTREMAHQDSGSRQAGLEIMKKIDMTKYALVITSTFLRIVSSLIAKASGLESKVRNFSTREDAIAWLHKV